MPEKKMDGTPRKLAWLAQHGLALMLLCLASGMVPCHAQDAAADDVLQGDSVTSQGHNAEPRSDATPKQPATEIKPSGSNTGTLNFVDADIESVIAAVGDFTNITFIIDPRVKGTLTLVSDKPLSKAQAFQLLTSVLRLRGYAAVPGNGYIKVVPEAEAKLQAPPVQTGAVHGDQIATQIFHLKFESAANLVTVLRPLITPNNTINADPATNSLIVTDYADNLMRLGKIITSLDEPVGNDVVIVPIRYGIASDIAVIASRLLEPNGTSAEATGHITLLAYPQNNSVLVRAPSEARANLAKAVIEKLDQPTDQPGNVHVVYLRNAEATKLAQTLRAVVSFDTSLPSVASATSGHLSASNTASQSNTSLSSGVGASAATPSSSSQATQGGLSSGGAAGFIQADSTTNTLIITASEPVYRNLRAVIDQLDARRAQVYIEGLIVEVDANKASEFGVQWAGASGNSSSNVRVGLLTGFTPQTSGNNLISQAAAKAAGTTPLAPGNGLTLGILNQSGLGALVHALETDTSANILSMPNLITLDNEEAKIMVGNNVPFITGQYTTVASSGSAGISPFQTVERQDIGLTLRVKPQVSEGGTVRMAIYQETSAISDTTNPAGIITSKRSLDTNVLVDDGQIIVLGGLIDDNIQDSIEKVPALGDIPIIGSLFRYKTRSRVKTDLMVFLRPTVIRNNEQSVQLAVDRYDFIRNEEAKQLPEQSSLLPNINSPQLPPLQNGRLDGGLTVNQPQPAPAANSSGVAQPPAAEKPSINK
jgi:general secretion pathway protein D